MNIFKRLTLYLKVSNKFRPYFSKKDKSMAVFKTVENNIPSDVTKIYEKICELPPKKYRKDRATYEAFVDKTKEHNAEVEQIKTIISSWDVRKVMEDPYSLKQEHLDECANAAKLLKKVQKERRCSCCVRNKR